MLQEQSEHINMNETNVKKYDTLLASIQQQLGFHPFIVPRSFQNPYFQTFSPFLLPYFKCGLLRVTKKFITIPDGTRLIADCVFQENYKHHSTIVVLDGIIGSSNSRFSLGMGNKAFYFGFNVILLNHRGQGDSMSLTSSLFDSGLEGDLGYALGEINEWGFKNIYLVGLSHGGYLALREMGIQGKTAKKTINGLVVISPPIDPNEYLENINKRSLFSKLFIREANKLIEKRAQLDPPGSWELSKLKSIKTIRQWDEIVLHTLGNFTTLEEYLAEANVLPLIPNIAIPTLAIHSYDDLLVSARQFEKQEIQNNPYIITMLTKYGGHGGFITLRKNNKDLDMHWAQNRALEFFRLLYKE